MEHVVFYPSAEGVQAFKRVDSLDAAVGFVEHLRNSENITEFSVHSLSAVPLAFRAYYHVELPTERADVRGHHRADPADASSSDSRADDDRAAEWVAEAEVLEPAAPVPAAIAEAEAPAPFADAPPVGAQPEPEPAADAVTGDVIPSGRRSMGFFAR